MNKRQPAIPERSSSLINANSQFGLKEIKTRKVSAMTTRSESSSISEFLENKIHEVSLDIEYSTRFRKALTDDESEATKHERNIELKRAEHQHREATRELVTLKRQKKLIENDIIEGQGHDSLEAAYTVAMLNRDRIPRPLNSMLVKAAHLVPKKLESPELSMLFGGDVNLSDPRNGN